jgi:hypothetical protein
LERHLAKAVRSLRIASVKCGIDFVLAYVEHDSDIARACASKHCTSMLAPPTDLVARMPLEVGLNRRGHRPPNKILFQELSAKIQSTILTVSPLLKCVVTFLHLNSSFGFPTGICVKSEDWL